MSYKHHTCELTNKNLTLTHFRGINTDIHIKTPLVFSIQIKVLQECYRSRGSMFHFENACRSVKVSIFFSKYVAFISGKYVTCHINPQLHCAGTQYPFL